MSIDPFASSGSWPGRMACDSGLHVSRTNINDTTRSCSVRCRKTREIVRVKGQDPWRAFQTWRGARIETQTRRLVFRGSATGCGWSSCSRGGRSFVKQSGQQRPGCTVLILQCPGYGLRYEQYSRAPAAGIDRMLFGPRSEPSLGWCGRLSDISGHRDSLCARLPGSLGIGVLRRRGQASSLGKKNRSQNYVPACSSGLQAVVFLFESIAECYVRAFPVSFG